MMPGIFKVLIPCLCVFLSFGCGCGERTAPDERVEVPSESMPEGTPAERMPAETPVDPMLSGISLPEGFSISLYSNEVPGARSLALGTDGTLFVGTRSRTVYALSDTDGDNYAETVNIIADNLNTPNGVAFRDGDLYVAEVSRILRYGGIESRLSSPPAPAVVIDTLPRDTHHGWKFIRFGPDDKLYVPVGAPCNVCKRNDERYAAILRLNPDGTNLEVFARGVRNTVGFDWHPESGVLWFTDNGRDNISRDQRINDNSPPDELNRAGEAGLHFGFPYCHGADVRDPQFGSERGCATNLHLPSGSFPRTSRRSACGSTRVPCFPRPGKT